MEKKRSVGTTVIGIILFLFPFITALFFNLLLLITTADKSLWGWNGFIQSCFKTFLFQNYWFAFLLFGILGIGILKLNNKIRLVTVTIAVGMALGGPLGLVIGIFSAGPKIHAEIIKNYRILTTIFPWLLVIPFCLLYALIAYYLTRPKIKEQFK